MPISNDMPTDTVEEAFTARVVGRVQGVGFRYATQREAERLGCDGWVRNGSDGAVELFAQGNPAALSRLRAFLALGPPAARVAGVTAAPAEPDPTLAPGFHVRF